MRRTIAAGFALVVCLSLFVGVAAADNRVGGTVVVEAGETVDDVTAVGGTVVVEGTVDGDLSAYGGNVRIAESGEVTGIVRAYGGGVRIDGRVGGNVLAYGGSVTLGESGAVDRTFGAVGGGVTVDGTVGDDANVFARTVTLGPTATVEGDLTYEGSLEGDETAVEGVVQRTRDLALLPPVGATLAALSFFMFFANLLLGAVLLYAGPRFADSAYRTSVAEPLRTGGAGLAAVLAVGLTAALLSMTVVGIPLAVALLLLAVVGAWVAAVYGRYVVGEWLLSYTDLDNPYLALVVGAVVVAVVGLVPYLGSVLQTVVFLFGAGVVALGLLQLYDLVSGSRSGLADI